MIGNFQNELNGDLPRYNSEFEGSTVKIAVSTHGISNRVSIHSVSNKKLLSEFQGPIVKGGTALQNDPIHLLSHPKVPIH